MKKGPETLTASNEASEAERIGRRIREIREARGITRIDLGEKLELNSDRVQKYENGICKPRPDMLMKIANALDVETAALAEPVIASPIGFMYALFEMEKEYAMNIDDIDGRIMLSFGMTLPDKVKNMLKGWELRKHKLSKALERASTEEERSELLLEYDIWKWTFPRFISSILHDADIEQQKNQIIDEIARLQRKLADLETAKAPLNT